MIELQLGYHYRKNSYADAYVDLDELDNGEKIIYLGTCDMDLKTNILKTQPERILYKSAFGYDTWDEYTEDYAESIVTHETLHIVLHGIDGHRATRAFDLIDREDAISLYGYDS